jgi:phospholipid/cholesterol/gamma-HCH transport system ATP-binding protein
VSAPHEPVSAKREPVIPPQEPVSALHEPVIALRDVRKSFGAQVVLDGLSFDVPRGKCLAIMGPSGTGKSVILRHVIGLMRADSGTVSVEGRDVARLARRELSELRKRMGFVFQEGALINWLDVGENVALPLRENTTLSDAEIRRKVQEKLDLVHIPDAWQKMPSQISGGMKKRVGLARALITDPEIVLYDEPNAGLDPEISQSINELLRELHERLSVTALLVEHRVRCIRTVADEVLFLEKGRVLLQAPPREFFASDHPRLVQFLGQDPD